MPLGCPQYSLGVASGFMNGGGGGARRGFSSGKTMTWESPGFSFTSKTPRSVVTTAGCGPSDAASRFSDVRRTRCFPPNFADMKPNQRPSGLNRSWPLLWSNSNMNWTLGR